MGCAWSHDLVTISVSSVWTAAEDIRRIQRSRMEDLLTTTRKHFRKENITKSTLVQKIMHGLDRYIQGTVLYCKDHAWLGQVHTGHCTVLGF